MDGCALVSTNAGLEPRHRRVPARDRPLRDAALERRLPRGHRPGAAGPLLARLRPRADRARTRALARPRPREARRSPSTTSRSPSSTCTRRVPRRGPSRRRERGRDGDDLRAPPAPRRRGARLHRLPRRRGASGATRRCRAPSSSSPRASSPSPSPRTPPSSGRSPLFVAVVPWLPLPGRPAWPPALLLPVVAPGDDARDARRLLRRGPLSRGRDPGPRAPCRRGTEKAGPCAVLSPPRRRVQGTYARTG